MDYRSLSGQSAIEYLMTYGWMLLVVAVVGGAVFSLAQGDSPETVSGFAGSDVIVQEYGVNNEDNLQFEMRSGGSDDAIVSEVNVSDPETGKYVFKEFTGDTKVEVGGSKIFEIPNVSRKNSANTLDVSITYNTGGLTNLTVSGTISGSLKILNTTETSGDPIAEDSGVLNTQADVYEDDGDLTSFSGNKSYFSVVNGGVSGDKAVEISASYVDTNDYIRTDGDGFEKGQRLRFWTNTSTAYDEGITFGMEGPRTGYRATIYDGQYMYLETVNDGSVGILESKSIPDKSDYYGEVEWKEDDEIIFRIYESSSFEQVNTSISKVDSSYSGKKSGFYTAWPDTSSYTAYYDVIEVLE